MSPQSERLHCVELSKNLRMDCAGEILISPKKLVERALNKMKNGKGSPDQITADVLKALLPECLEKLARSLSMMCWEMTFPEDCLGSLTVTAPKVVGATRLTKFRPIAGLCAMRKVLGYVWLMSLGCWLALVVAGCRIVERMAEKNCGGTSGLEEGVRSCGSSSGLQGNETTRCESVLDGIDCCNLEWKLHEGTFGNSLVEQSSNEQRGARISGHLHNDHGIGVARSDQKLDKPETGVETGRLCAGCDLLCGRCGAGCCVDCCFGSDGGRGYRKVERCRSDCWCTENTLDVSPEVVGGRLGVCGIEVVSGRECKTCDCTQISSSQQVSGEMEICSEFFMASKIDAFEHYNVAGFSLEFECPGRRSRHMETKLRVGDREWWQTSLV